MGIGLTALLVAVCSSACSGGVSDVKEGGVQGKQALITDSKADLVLNLALDQDELERGQIVVIAEIINTGVQVKRVLTWNTPFESTVLGEIYEITYLDDERSLTYQGPTVKRVLPQSADYLNISPNQLFQNQQDISRRYRFCRPGNYRLVFVGQLLDESSRALDFETHPLDFRLPTAFSGC